MRKHCSSGGFAITFPLLFQKIANDPKIIRTLPAVNGLDLDQGCGFTKIGRLTWIVIGLLIGIKRRAGTGLKIRQSATYSLSIQHHRDGLILPMKKPRQTLRKTFAANLKIVREARGLSQEALAHDAGLHRTYVGSVERGERNISIDNIERLARALGVEAGDLLRRS
jgi:DNA-binding XRE family transcriptional regulator